MIKEDKNIGQRVREDTANMNFLFQAEMEDRDWVPPANPLPGMGTDLPRCVKLGLAILVSGQSVEDGDQRKKYQSETKERHYCIKFLLQLPPQP